MPRSRRLAVLRVHVLWFMSLGACETAGDTQAPDSAGGANTPAARPAEKGSLADLASRFERAAAEPATSAEPVASLTGPLLEAASKQLTKSSIVHELDQDASALWISADTGSPLGRMSEALRSSGDTRMVYDLAYLRDHPGERVGYDPGKNVLRIRHLVLLGGGDIEEPTLRHEQARAEVWALYRRSQPSPYHARLGHAKTTVHADELHADARDLARELQGIGDLLISPDDTPVTSAELALVLAAHEGGDPLPRPLTELELRWDRLLTAALHGADSAALFEPQLKQAQTRARAKGAAQFSPAAHGATALIALEPDKDDPEGRSFALFLDLAASTGPDDPKNQALLKTQLTATRTTVERHLAHFNAVVELLRRVAATPSSKERRDLFAALAVVITPVPDDAPAKTRTTAAYLKRFDEALQGKTPAKK